MPSPRCLRVMHELFANPTRSSWSHLSNNKSVFEVDFANGTTKRIAPELRTYLEVVQVAGRPNLRKTGEKNGRLPTAYRWAPAALPYLPTTHRQAYPQTHDGHAELV